MNIEYQLEYIRNRFNNKNIIDKSMKTKMSHAQTNLIVKTIQSCKIDCESVIDDDFTVELKEGVVYILDSN